MDSDRMNRWLTLGANLSVLVGIGLLYYEIHQATLTTRAEMVSSHQDRWVTIDLSWQEGNFAATWAKAMESPDELTVADMVQLNGFMWSFIDHMGTARILQELGVLDDEIIAPDQIIRENAYIFIGNRFSRAWIDENRSNLSTETLTVIDSAIADESENETLEMFNRIKRKLEN